MTAQDILEDLSRTCPDFRAAWNGENLHRQDDGSFTACGVFTKFTDFFSREHQKLKKEELVAIGTLIRRIEPDDFLATAAYTCFLENIAGDPPGDTIAPYLSQAALRHMRRWGLKA